MMSRADKTDEKDWRRECLNVSCDGFRHGTCEGRCWQALNEWLSDSVLSHTSSLEEAFNHLTKKLMRSSSWSHAHLYSADTFNQHILPFPEAPREGSTLRGTEQINAWLLHTKALVYYMNQASFNKALSTFGTMLRINGIDPNRFIPYTRSLSRYGVSEEKIS